MQGQGATVTPRRYIRHPSEIPISIQSTEYSGQMKLKDISLGGLCIQVRQCLPKNSEISIRISVLAPSFQAQGHVVWCRHLGPERALLGVCFADQETAYAVRMVEQVCHIERYRQRISEERGRDISSEEAAQEWIGRYAARFPQ